MTNEELCTLLKNFINNFGFELEVKCDGGDWYYDMFNDIINISIYGNNYIDNLYKKVCYELGLEWNCPMFLMSFLHEVGHDYTIDFCDEFEWNLVDVFVKLKGIMCDNITDNDYYTYFYSPREKMATEWACDFANEHRIELEDLWKNITGK